MPQYIWECQKCGKRSMVIRHVDEIEDRPSKDEKVCDCDPSFLKRIMCATVNRWRFND